MIMMDAHPGAKSPGNDKMLAAIALLAGALSWVVIAQGTGRSEAWDSALYFVAGVPLLAALSAALARIAPRHAWRWGIYPYAGQLAAMLVMQGIGNLLPLGLIVFAVLSIASVAAALVAAALRRRTKSGDPRS